MGMLNATEASSDMAPTVPLNLAAMPSHPSAQVAGNGDLDDAFGAGSAFAMKPVVPRTGELFTASDIDAIMDNFGNKTTSDKLISDRPIESSTFNTSFNLSSTLGRDVVGQN